MLESSKSNLIHQLCSVTLLEANELPHPSPAPANVAAGPSVSYKFVPLNEKETISVGGETHGSDPVEEDSELGVENNDEVDGSSNHSPSKFKVRVMCQQQMMLQVMVPDELVNRSTIVHRGSVLRNRQCVKKQPKKPRKMFRPINRLPSVQKETANASSNPTPPTRMFPVFIGGFNAFAPPTQANRDAFLKQLTAAKSVDVSSGSGYSISSLGPLFHCNGVCSHEALDRVVNLIHNRRDRLPSARFEFVPPSFFLELMRNYAGFDAIKEKHKFAFSTPLKPQFMHRPGWYTQVDFVYNVTSYLTPIATMLPHLISGYCIASNPGEMNFHPIPISRIEVPVLLEHPGVASLILLEMAAADQPLNSLSLTEEEVRVAAENYAIAALFMVRTQSHVDPMFTSNNFFSFKKMHVSKDPLPPVSESNPVPDVSGVVNQILSDAGVIKSSKFDRLNEQELPHPSPAPANVAAGPSVSYKFVPLNEKETISVGGETHGSDPVEEDSELGVENNDEVDGSSNHSPSKFKVRVMCQQQMMLQVMVPDELVNRSTIVHRGSVLRNRQCVKKQPKKPRKMFRPINRLPSVQKETANASSNPTPPTRMFPVFIGGFNAFAPPTQANRDAFLKQLTAAKSVDVSSGSGYSISSLGPLFHCNGVCSHEALDRVVNLIHNRRDRLPSARFEFVPPSFFLELMRNYAGFDAIKEKHKFAFSTPLKPQFMHRPGWYTQVDFVYNVTSYLTPIATMLPHLISGYCIASNPGEMNFRPIPISRIEVPVLLEHPGVASLILLEMAAADQPLNSLSLTEEEVRVAAENYAIAALFMG
ncbi:hypothetical protein Bca101_088599 [Brassica carinata]